MNREIKFQFWYESSKTMSPGMTIEEVIADLDKSSSPMTRKERLSYSAKRQYTGFKDKNGMEVYEGDILRGKDVPGYTWRDYDMYSVVYEDGGFCLGQGDHELLFWALDHYEMVVIGNIYEHPELVNEL